MEFTLNNSSKQSLVDNVNNNNNKYNSSSFVISEWLSNNCHFHKIPNLIMTKLKKSFLTKNLISMKDLFNVINDKNIHDVFYDVCKNIQLDSKNYGILILEIYKELQNYHYHNNSDGEKNFYYKNDNDKNHEILLENDNNNTNNNYDIIINNDIEKNITFTSLEIDTITQMNEMQNKKEANLLPTVEEFYSMFNKINKYLVQDIYDKHKINGSGFRFLRTNDKEEKRKMYEIYKKFQQSLPDQGEDIDDVLKEYFDALEYTLHENQPGMMAMVPGGGSMYGVIGHYITLMTNRYPSIMMVTPQLVSIDNCIIKWFGEMIGFNKTSTDYGGYITSGGSTANLQSIHCCREYFISKYKQNYNSGDNGNSVICKLTIYMSQEAHFCLKKSIRFLGIPLENIRIIPCYNLHDRRICCESIEEYILKDIKNNYIPMMIISTAGITTTGAIDNLPALYEISRKYNLWLHCDGAYGGLFNITQQGSVLLKGIELCDSVVVDPHKSFFLPYGLGMVLVKRRELLYNANQISYTPYLPSIQNKNDGREEYDNIIDTTHLGPEHTKNHRGASLWFAIKLLGLENFRKELNLKLELTQFLKQQLLNYIPCIELLIEPMLTIIAFRLHPKSILNNENYNLETLDLINEEFLDEINSKGNVVISCVRNPENVKGYFFLRCCILSYRTQRIHTEKAFKDILESANVIIKKYNLVSDK